MPWSFWASYLLKLAIAGAVLAAVYVVARKLRGWRFAAERADRALRVVDAAALSPHAAVYVIEAGARRFLVGTSGAAIATLAELERANLPAD